LFQVNNCEKVMAYLGSWWEPLNKRKGVNVLRIIPDKLRVFLSYGLLRVEPRSDHQAILHNCPHERTWCTGEPLDICSKLDFCPFSQTSFHENLGKMGVLDFSTSAQPQGLQKVRLPTAETAKNRRFGLLQKRQKST